MAEAHFALAVTMTIAVPGNHWPLFLCISFYFSGPKGNIKKDRRDDRERESKRKSRATFNRRMKAGAADSTNKNASVQKKKGYSNLAFFVDFSVGTEK